jgi:hypothetical protein
VKLLAHVLLATGLSVSFAAAAKAECSPENWKDCKGKPWVTGDQMDTPIGESGGRTRCGAATTRPAPPTGT